MIKSRRIKRARNVACMGEITNVYKIFEEKRTGKRLFKDLGMHMGK
jgi:hypothetical protein